MTNSQIIKVERYKDEFVVLLHEVGIAEVEWNTKLEQITEDSLRNLTEAIGRLGNGKQLPVYVSTFEFMNTTVEGKKYAATAEAQKFTLANAVLVDNLAKRILFNFYMKIYKPQTPCKAFSSKEVAFKWLLSFSKEQTLNLSELNKIND